jgi:hypothetical protein
MAVRIMGVVVRRGGGEGEMAWAAARCAAAGVGASSGIGGFHRKLRLFCGYFANLAEIIQI